MMALMAMILILGFSMKSKDLNLILLLAPLIFRDLIKLARSLGLGCKRTKLSLGKKKSYFLAY